MAYRWDWALMANDSFQVAGNFLEMSDVEYICCSSWKYLMSMRVILISERFSPVQQTQKTEK